MRCGALALLLCLCGGAAHAAPAPLRVVPADDFALASTLLANSGRSAPVALFDAREQPALARFVAAADRPVECYYRRALPAAARVLLESATKTPCTLVEDLAVLARRLRPDATSAVVVPAAGYEWLLRAAAFAGALDAALVPLESGRPPDAESWQSWPSGTLYALPGSDRLLPAPALGGHLVRIESPQALQDELLRRLPAPPRTVVVTNPLDRLGRFSPSTLSLLAPVIAAAHRAPLILVADAAPAAVEAQVHAVIDAAGLPITDIYLVGDELALRSHRVPDPVLAAGGPEALGGARDVRVELFSEIQHGRPQDYAVGRFVAEDAAAGSLTLARQLHAPPAGARVTVLSNADEVFSLGETISRTTVSELRNAGAQVDAHYREAVTPAVILAALQRSDLLVWEGHARDLTLEERGGIAVERAPPLVVLQGCYTLDRSDPFILFERGTQAIVATSAAIYSASGSAFARAFFDALLYDGADLGTAVRNARNFLLAVTELKKRRGHADWPKTYRAALAFALWGDPTSRPPLPDRPPRLTPAGWQLHDGTLRLEIPKGRLKTATVGRYRAAPVPRAMLSGLILRDGDKPEREVKELFYAVLQTPAPRRACPPAGGWDVVSLFAPRTHTLSVLARPAGDKPGAGAPAGVFALPLVAPGMSCDAQPPAAP